MFRFRLQKVLELRAAVEKDSAVMLSEARIRADAARAERARLEDALSQNVAHLHGTNGSAKVSELRSRSEAVTRLEARVASASDQVNAAETQVIESDEAFQAAFRERHVLDRLKDRYSLLWKLAASKGHLTEMDGIALARFAATRALHEDESS